MSSDAGGGPRGRYRVHDVHVDALPRVEVVVVAVQGQIGLVYPVQGPWWVLLLGADPHRGILMHSHLLSIHSQEAIQLLWGELQSPRQSGVELYMPALDAVTMRVPAVV